MCFCFALLVASLCAWFLPSLPPSIPTKFILVKYSLLALVSHCCVERCLPGGGLWLGCHGAASCVEPLRHLHVHSNTSIGLEFKGGGGVKLQSGSQ